MEFRPLVRAKFGGLVVPRFIRASGGPDESCHFKDGRLKDMGQSVISVASPFLLSSATYI